MVDPLIYLEQVLLYSSELSFQQLLLLRRIRLQN